MNCDGRRLHNDGSKRKFLSFEGEDRASFKADGRRTDKVPQRLDVEELGVELEHGLLPTRNLGARRHHADATGRRRWRRRPEIQKNPGPSFPYSVGDVQVPVDCVKESRLVLVDLLSVKARDLAPGAGGVVSVLKVLGRENEGGKKDTATALQGTSSLVIPRLFHGEILSRDVPLDEDEIVHGYLQCRVAGARPLEGLLDEGPQGKNGLVANLVSANNRGQGPDGLDHESCRVDEVVNEVNLSVMLMYELGRAPRARASTAGVLPLLGRNGIGSRGGRLSLLGEGFARRVGSSDGADGIEGRGGSQAPGRRGDGIERGLGGCVGPVRAGRG